MESLTDSLASGRDAIASGRDAVASGRDARSKWLNIKHAFFQFQQVNPVRQVCRSNGLVRSVVLQAMKSFDTATCRQCCDSYVYLCEECGL